MLDARFSGIRTSPDTPVDPLGSLGPAIKPAAPAQPDPVKSFETQRDGIGNHSKAIETVTDTLKKGGAPVPIVTDGQESDWEGICYGFQPVTITFNLSPEELKGIEDARKVINDWLDANPQPDGIRLIDGEGSND